MKQFFQLLVAVAVASAIPVNAAPPKTQTVTLDASGNVLNTIPTNYPTGGLKVNNVSVAGGAGGGGGSLNDIPTGRELRVDLVNGNDTTAAASSTGHDLSKPFLTLTAAVTAANASSPTASAPQAIYVGPGTTALTATLTLSDNVSIISTGGPSVSKITSTRELVLGAHACIVPGDNTEISGFTIQGIASAGAYQGLIGSGESDAGATGVIVRDCRLIGDSDGFYFGQTDTPSTMKVYNTVIETKYDAVALFQPATVELFNCTATVTGPSLVTSWDGTSRAMGAHITGASIIARGCQLTVSGGTSFNWAAQVTSGGRIELQNCRSTVSGTNALDLKKAGTGVAVVNNYVRSDGAALVFESNSNTYTDLTRYLSKDKANTINFAPGANTITPGLTLSNTTAAVTGAGGQQHSPALDFIGRGYKSGSSPGSKEILFEAGVTAIEGVTNPTGIFSISSAIRQPGNTSPALSHAFYFYSSGGMGIGSVAGTDPGNGALGVDNVYLSSATASTPTLFDANKKIVSGVHGVDYSTWTAGTPASASATGTAGDVKWDASYIYICIATDTWKRVAIATWP